MLLSSRYKQRPCFLFCCSFDSIQQFHELYDIFQSPELNDPIYWSFFLQPIADDDTDIPDMGKGFIQSLLSTDPRKLQCIHSIELLWQQQPQFRLQKLCDLLIGNVGTKASVQTGKNGGIAGKDFRRKCFIHNAFDHCHLVLATLTVALFKGITLTAEYQSLLTVQVVLSLNKG